MTARPGPTRRASSAACWPASVCRASASSQDVETAHDGLVDFLEGAPTDLRCLGPAPDRRHRRGVRPAVRSDDRPVRSDEPRAIAAAPDRGPCQPPTRTLGHGRRAFPGPASGNAEPSQSRRPGRPVPSATRRLLIGAGAHVVGVVAIAIAVFNLNGGTGVPPINGSPAPEAAASPGVDPAQVGDAHGRRSRPNPKDVASLQALADLYYQRDDYDDRRRLPREDRRDRPEERDRAPRARRRRTSTWATSRRRREAVADGPRDRRRTTSTPTTTSASCT